MKITQEGLWADLKIRNPKVITAKYGSVLGALSHALRGAIVAAEGKTLFVADYSAIEARVVMWLAGEEEALESFRRGEDIYSVMASEIYNKPCSKEDTPDERQVGKTAILGLGFQMGASKFVATVEKMTGIIISEEMAKQVVDTYRAKFAGVKQLWWEMEAAAIRAVKGRKSCTVGHVKWVVEGFFLYCELPSGRRLAYPFPKVGSKATPWGEVRPQLTFMGISPITHKWTRMHTYGGSLVENAVQAIARDLLADALLACENTGIYLPVLSVHDEGICEVNDAAGSLQEFNRLMTTSSKWAKGLPIGIESWKGKRYHK